VPLTRFDRALYQNDPIEPDVASNDRPFEGRLYVLVIDDLTVEFSHARDVRQIAGDFVRNQFKANDLMAVVHTAGRADASQGFTNSKRLLLASIDRTQGCRLAPVTAQNAGVFDRTESSSCEADQIRATQRTLRTLKNVAASLSSTHGRRKAILLVGERLALGVSSAMPDTAGTQLLGDLVEPEVRVEARAAIEALIRANTSVYGVDPTGLRNGGPEDIVVQGAFPTDRFGNPASATPDFTQQTVLSEIRLGQDGLRQISGETGGFAVMNMNSYGAALDRIVADNSVYYVLAFQPADTRRDGKFHNVEVRVKRPGLTVRARRGYFAPRDKATPSSTENLKNASPEIRDALNALLPATGVGLQVNVAAFRSGDDASVLLTAEIAGRDVRSDADSQIELAYLAVDTKGEVHDGLSDKIALRLRPEIRALVNRNGFRAMKRLKLKPGRYQVRVAARNLERGSIGSVVADLEIPDYRRQPFGMSNLLLTSIAASRIPTIRSDEAAQVVLPSMPTAHRAFPIDDVLALFAEIYDDGGAAAHKIDIVTRVRSDEGRLFFTHEDARDSGELKGKRGAYDYTARVPLTGLTPGPYVLEVEARSRLATDSVVSRQIRFTVASAAQPDRP